MNLDKVVDTPELDVVRIIFEDSKNKVLLVKEYDDENWKLPGGKIHDGETIFEAIVRETMEELGVKITREVITKYVKTTIPNSPNFRHIVRADLSGMTIQKTDEVVEFEFFAPDNIPDGKFYEHITSAIDLTK